ncbi:MAG: DUF4437 domain-containing protein [Spirochaetota bacterium]
MKTFICIIICLALLGNCKQNNEHFASSIEVLSVKDVKWEKLNPARGDKSPQAANLWGDRKKNTPTGFLVKFVDGFSSPPHIHNVSYRGIVISGLVHNDDPGAAPMWMPAGSYWTQPAGESHITSAKGNTNIAFIEIDSGPYLVKPTEEAFDNGEKPVNIHKSNIIWQKQKTVELARIWQGSEKKAYATLVKYQEPIVLKARETYIVVIAGTVLANSNSQKLQPGSLIHSIQQGRVRFVCLDKTPCILYAKANTDLTIE